MNNFNFLLSLVSLFFKLNRSTFLPERCGWFNVFWVINFVLKWLKKNQMYNLKAGGIGQGVAGQGGALQI